ncbi:MAG: DUF721 domain-containing protein [Bdellovibrionales bacterium]|nr:DUF721 domain-containing protein [Bdellovibrionales bacterium]
MRQESVSSEISLSDESKDQKSNPRRFKGDPRSGQKKTKTFRNMNGYRVSGRSYRSKRPEQVAGVLRSLFNSPKLRDKFAKYSFVTLWGEIVGGRICQHATPLKVHKGVLYVQVSSPIWAQELAFLKDSILLRLSKNVPDGTPAVNDLRFVVSENL